MNISKRLIVKALLTLGLIQGTQIALAQSQKASDVGVCAGALQLEFQKGDRATAMKFYNQKKNDIDMHDSRIARACPNGINESCFNTLPLDTRIFMESRHNAIKDLNSAGNSSLLNKPMRGNDPMTRGFVLMAYCS